MQTSSLRILLLSQNSLKKECKSIQVSCYEKHVITTEATGDFTERWLLSRKKYCKEKDMGKNLLGQNPSFKPFSYTTKTYIY